MKQNMSNISEPEIAIRVEGVDVFTPMKVGSFKTQRNKILSNINLDIYKSESIGVLGKNGSGKSSLMKLLAGVYSPDVGQINRYGNNVTNLSMNLTTQPFLSGWDNIIIKGLISGMSRSLISSKIDSIVEYTGLGDKIYHPVRTYSSGMRARLNFSVALENASNIVLIDEMLGVGDAEFREKSHASIMDMIKSNRTVVLVSHNLEVIKSVCTRAAIIENTTITDIGKSDEIIEKYNH